MLDAVGSDETFRRYLPRLAALLRENAVLLVLDNLETLLSQSNTWRDSMWTALIDTLIGHGGESRVVLTSRVAPLGLNTDRVAVLPTHALSLAESALLARELPNLGALLHDQPGCPARRSTSCRATQSCSTSPTPQPPIPINFEGGSPPHRKPA
jgi:hypothetical protein